MVYVGPSAAQATYNQINVSISADPKAAARSFYGELTKLLADYADPEKDLTWMGITIEASEKYNSPAAAILLSDARNTLGQLVEAPVAYYLNPILQAEKNIADLVSGS